MARKKYSVRKTFDLLPDTAEKLARFAEIANDSESAIVREALTAYLDKALRKSSKK